MAKRRAPVFLSKLWTYPPEGLDPNESHGVAASHRRLPLPRGRLVFCGSPRSLRRRTARRRRTTRRTSRRRARPRRGGDDASALGRDIRAQTSTRRRGFVRESTSESAAPLALSVGVAPLSLGGARCGDARTHRRGGSLLAPGLTALPVGLDLEGVQLPLRPSDRALAARALCASASREALGLRDRRGCGAPGRRPFSRADPHRVGARVDVRLHPPHDERTRHSRDHRDRAARSDRRQGARVAQRTQRARGRRCGGCLRDRMAARLPIAATCMTTSARSADARQAVHHRPVPPGAPGGPELEAQRVSVGGDADA